MFETTSEARCVHSCSALEAAFSVRYSFQASVANAIETMQLQERGVQNCIRTEYMVFLSLDSRSRRRTQGLLKLDEFVDLLWYIPYVCICMNPKEKAHPSFYVPAGPTFASLGPQISDAPCSAAVPWRRRRSWRSWTLLITSKRTEPKMIWVNFR